MELSRIKLSDIKEIAIEQDENPESPREYIDDSMPKMVCFHSRYNLGDKHSFNNPMSFQKEITNGKYHYLPLYLYDHSGITMSTKPFSCPWDSGQVGYIYISKDKMPDEKHAHKIMVEDVKTYDQYLTGNVKGFIVYIDNVYTDSCWGFYDLDSLMDHADLNDEEKEIVKANFTW